MSITTKGGDGGYTDGPNQQRVLKYEDFPNLVGDLDELNAHIGMCAKDTWQPDSLTVFTDVQHRLLDIGASLYTSQHFLVQDDIAALESYINEHEPQLKGFVIPETTWHLARAVCRRAERSMAHYRDFADSSVDPLAVQYLNRLSDALFIAAIIERNKITYWEKRA